MTGVLRCDTLHPLLHIALGPPGGIRTLRGYDNRYSRVF